MIPRRVRAGPVGMLAAGVLLAAWPQAAWARTPGLPRLTEFHSDGARVSFLQAGTATTLDLQTGAVLERGGAIHDEWPRPRECDVFTTRSCALAQGTLRLTDAFGGALTVLEAEIGRAAWKATLRPYRSTAVRRVVEVPGKLLLDSPTHFGVVLLECLDAATGKSLWLYAYHSPHVRAPTRAEGIAEAKEALRDFVTDEERRGAVGTVAGSPAEVDDVSRYLTRRYEGVLVVDPDPLSRSSAGRLVAGTWVALVALLLALGYVLFRAAPGRIRSGHLAALYFPLAFMVLVLGRLDPLLGRGLWAAFLVASVAIYASRKNERPAVAIAVIGTLASYALSSLYFR